MNPSAFAAFTATLVAAVTFTPTLSADDKASGKHDMEAATRLQIFLDRAEFAPGKIDGRYGEFTMKALALYRASKSKASVSVPPEAGKPEPESSSAKAPDVSGLDLASVDPIFTTYKVSEDDLKLVGELADSVPEQAKQKSLPYKSVGEAIAEKFHADIDFLAALNPGKISAIKVGDTLTVPNVEPFELPAVKNLKAGSEIPTEAANDADEETDPKNQEGESAAPTAAVKVDTASSMLTVYEGDQIIAAYPVTIGSAQTSSPIGDWKVRGVAKLPNFRYDKSMLKSGERSSNFHMLPPGPNSPVGVIWIQLNKKGIGLHGTSDPDAIGRNASHGCVRMANWDVVRLAAKVKTGVPVSIH